MYHTLLTNRYLTSRVIPFIAVAAVALCVALVIIVVSVMTGFLDMVRSSGRTLMGDVIVSYSLTGIPYYQRLITHIEKLPAAKAATPVVDSWGLLKMPYPAGDHKDTETVQVWGIEPEGFASVTGYADALYWRPYDPRELADMAVDDPRRLINERPPGETLTPAQRLETNALTLHDPRSNRPGIVLGVHVSEGNERKSDGSIQPVGIWWMPQFQVTLTMLPLATGGGIIPQPANKIFPVVNEFFSGVFLIDDTRVMIPLSIAQEMLLLSEDLKLDKQKLDDEGLPTVIGVHPARATMVLVRAADGVSPDELRGQVERAYESFHQELEADDTALEKPPPLDPVSRLSIRTWEEQQAKFIGPIEKERELMRTLFSLVYLVCAGLVLSIFWAIVYEKTRDIGILRSIGAPRLGISWIFLRYGLVVGAAGAVAGLGLAYLVVHNINAIHDAMGSPPAWLAIGMLVLALLSLGLTVYKGRGGELMPVTLGALVTISLFGVGAVILLIKKGGGFKVWDPSVYYFTEMPNNMDKFSAVITMAGAVVFSLIGAFLPAAKAADTDPVRALRYE